MRLRISFWRMLKIAAIATAIGAVIVALGFFKLLFMESWGFSQIAIVVGYFMVVTLIFVITFCNHYYEVTKKEVIVKRLGKKEYYRFNEIIYIDEEESRKKKTITFVTARGDARYLTYDKEGKLIDIMLKECKNLITLDDLKKRFPNIYF